MESEPTKAETVFKDAERGLRVINPSLDDQALVRLLERHGIDEGAALDRYERLAQTETSGPISYLIGLILEDERRHHRVIEEIANAIAWGGFASPTVPTTPDIARHENHPELAAATDELLAIEREDARELRRLRRKLKPYADSTLWPLLIDLMLLDTEKHQRILEYIRSHLTKPSGRTKNPASQVTPQA